MTLDIIALIVIILVVSAVGIVADILSMNQEREPEDLHEAIHEFKTPMEDL